jgi:hypothetical protein
MANVSGVVSTKWTPSHHVAVPSLISLSRPLPKNRQASQRCPSCSKKFKDTEALWQHRISKHSVDPNIRPMGTLTGDAPEAEDLTGDDTHWVPCEVCGQAVPSHWQMGQHLETLKPLIGMKAVCMICDKVGEERGVKANEIIIVEPAEPRSILPFPSNSV